MEIKYSNEWSLDRETLRRLLAYFPALEGYNTWGKTYEETIKHTEETLTLYLESFDELSKSILEERGLKRPTSFGVTVRIPVIA
jgi:predicted RNase H-like HicB family nuclease